VTPVVETPFTADIKRLQDTLTADQAGELTRLADGLSKTRTPGAIASDISEAIKTDGLKAVAEFQVVRDRLKEIGTPDQIRALDEAVLGQLPSQIRDQLEGIFNPKSIQPDIKPETDRPITAIPLPSPNRPVHPGRERVEIQLHELSAREGEDDAGNGALVDLRERFRSADTDEERHSVAKDAVKALGNPDNARALRDQALLDLESEAQKSGMKPGEYLVRRNRITEAFPETRDKNGDIKVAALPLAVPYVIAGGAATAGVVGKYVQDNWENLGLDKVFGPDNRMDVAKPLPPIPGTEPTDIDFGQERFPDLSDEDHAPQVPNFDPPETDTQTPPFPDQGDEFNKPQIQEIRRKPNSPFNDDGHRKEIEARQKSGMPLGFRDRKQLDTFINDLHGRLEANGIKGSKVAIRGSAVTGRGFNQATGKHDGQPFRTERGNESDLDIAIANPALFEKAKKLGIPIRGEGSRTRVINNDDLKKLGLTNFKDQPFDTNDHDVSIMIYRSPKIMNRRGSNIRLDRKK